MGLNVSLTEITFERPYNKFFKKTNVIMVNYYGQSGRLKLIRYFEALLISMLSKTFNLCLLFSFVKFQNCQQIYNFMSCS